VAVKIRLTRIGKTHAPYYRVVVADSRTRRDGRAIEQIGIYQPLSDPSVIQIDSDRAQYWLGVGAQPSEQVRALLKRTGDWQKFTGSGKAENAVKGQPEKQPFEAPAPKSVIKEAVVAENTADDQAQKAAEQAEDLADEKLAEANAEQAEEATENAEA